MWLGLLHWCAWIENSGGDPVHKLQKGNTLWIFRKSSWNWLSFSPRVVYVSIREPHIWNFEVYKSCYTTWHLLSVFPCCCFIPSGGKIARIHWSFEEDQTVLAEGVGKLSDSKQRYINSIEFFTLKAVSLLPLMILHLKYSILLLVIVITWYLVIF